MVWTRPNMPRKWSACQWVTKTALTPNPHRARIICCCAPSPQSKRSVSEPRRIMMQGGFRWVVGSAPAVPRKYTCSVSPLTGNPPTHFAREDRLAHISRKTSPEYLQACFCFFYRTPLNYHHAGIVCSDCFSDCFPADGTCPERKMFIGHAVVVMDMDMV